MLFRVLRQCHSRLSECVSTRTGGPSSAVGTDYTTAVCSRLYSCKVTPGSTRGCITMVFRLEHTCCFVSGRLINGSTSVHGLHVSL